ncbi:MAG: cytochrome c oxidase subunit II, partial [Candidatus Zixiibacteriota bacterium]
RGEATTTSGVDHNLTLEIIWTAIPTILVMIIFVWGFKGFVRLYVVPAHAMQVNVTAQKWFWTFDYPEGVNAVNELIVPVDKPVKLLMSSKDVIHSFFVPNFRIKQDIVPNRYQIIWFEATQTGTFNLFCTQYCGKGHSEMVGKVIVKTQKEYQDWIDQASGPVAGETMADYGKKLYTSRACNTCHSIDGTPNTGPTFKGAYGRTETLADGTTIVVDENYIRESLLEPTKKDVSGYQPVMPTYQGILKQQQIDALIEFLKTVQ